MRELQAKHKEWCDKNFGGREPKASHDCMLEVATVADAVGQLAHSALKSYQGIRDDFDFHVKCFEQTKRITMSRLVYLDGPEALPASSARPSLPPLLGMIEEVGELVRASVYLDDKEDQIDAVGDIVLYLMDYCNKVGIDFEDAVRTTAEKVHARDWVKNPVNGEVGNE